MRWGQVYFALQACAGAVWWVLVFTVPWVHAATLGDLDPVLVGALDIPLFVVGSAIAAAGIRTAAWITTSWTLFVTLALAGYATLTSLAGWGVLLMAAAAGCSLIALALVALGRVPTEWILVGPFAFRVARGTRNVSATITQMLVFWVVFLGVVPIVIHWFEMRWRLDVDVPTTVPGIALLVLASALGVWSALTMSMLGKGTPLPSAMARDLVIAGPYRWVRNPMALAGIVQGVAVGLILSSWLVVVYAIAGSLLWNYAIRPLEEADLERRFGAEFRAYREAVNCWMPRLTPATVRFGASAPVRTGALAPKRTVARRGRGRGGGG